MATKKTNHAPTTTEAPAKKGAKKKVATVVETASTPEAAPPPAPTHSPTLMDLGVAYIMHLRSSGKSEGTALSYRIDFNTAIEELGADTRLADLTPERVLEFFGCDRVMKKHGGKDKSPLSIDKTRRVLRQALVWAQSAGLIEKAPLPEAAATH